MTPSPKLKLKPKVKMSSFQLAFPAIGTHWLIDVYDSPLSREKIESLIAERIEEFDRTYSRFRKDSLIWQISEKKGTYDFPPDSKEFFSLYEKLYQITGGKFTLLIGQALTEAGYDSSYNLIPKKINKVPDASSVYSFDYPSLTVKKPYVLDFGGLGKGYLIDIISNLFEENGIKSFCIDGGGDILCSNLKNPIDIGLENPMDVKQVIGKIQMKNGSLCASSGNRRKWDKFHHIMDPYSLNSPKNVLATWALADSAMIADGLATCLFLASPDKLLKYFEFEYLILYPDMTFDKSKNFPGELFLKKR